MGEDVKYCDCREVYPGVWACVVCDRPVVTSLRPKNRVCGKSTSAKPLVAKVTTKPKTSRPLAVQAGLCAHRGAVLEHDVPCELCGAKGQLYDIYACEIHGSCSLSKRKRGLQICAGCPDFRDPS